MRAARDTAPAQGAHRVLQRALPLSLALGLPIPAGRVSRALAAAACESAHSSGSDLRVSFGSSLFPRAARATRRRAGWQERGAAWSKRCDETWLGPTSRAGQCGVAASMAAAGRNKSGRVEKVGVTFRFVISIPATAAGAVDEKRTAAMCARRPCHSAPAWPGAVPATSALRRLMATLMSWTRAITSARSPASSAAPNFCWNLSGCQRACSAR